jgi:hypothetical protein
MTEPESSNQIAPTDPVGSSSEPLGPVASAISPSGCIRPAAAVALSGPWKARPVFIDSTFKDVQQ